MTLAGRVARVTASIDGKDLTDPIREPDPLPPRARVEVAGTVAEALDAVWADEDTQSGDGTRGTA